MLFCPPGDSTKRFFLSRNLARPFHFRPGGNGIRTHDTIFLYVDLANQCLKPLSHTSKLLIGICCVGWLPEGLSDPINCVSRSALARVLFLYLWARLYPDRSMDLPSIQARLHSNLPLVGRRLLFYEHPTTEWWTLPVFASDPTRREHTVKPSPYPPEWNSYLLRLVEKGESPGNWTVTLLLHYGEVHSRHDRSTSYRSARRIRLA